MAAADDLVAYFGHRNVDALVRVIRNTLDNIKKRITYANAVRYGDSKRTQLINLQSIESHRAIDQ